MVHHPVKSCDLPPAGRRWQLGRGRVSLAYLVKHDLARKGTGTTLGERRLDYELGAWRRCVRCYAGFGAKPGCAGKCLALLGTPIAPAEWEELPRTSRPSAQGRRDGQR